MNLISTSTELQSTPKSPTTDAPQQCGYCKHEQTRHVLSLEVRINGETRQSIRTGTPAGVGVLANPVVAEADQAN